jgi:hypothetical protein
LERVGRAAIHKRRTTQVRGNGSETEAWSLNARQASDQRHAADRPTAIGNHVGECNLGVFREQRHWFEPTVEGQLTAGLARLRQSSRAQDDRGRHGQRRSASQRIG